MSNTGPTNADACVRSFRFGRPIRHSNASALAARAALVACAAFAAGGDEVSKRARAGAVRADTPAAAAVPFAVPFAAPVAVPFAAPLAEPVAAPVAAPFAVPSVPFATSFAVPSVPFVAACAGACAEAFGGPCTAVAAVATRLSFGAVTVTRGARAAPRRDVPARRGGLVIDAVPTLNVADPTLNIADPTLNSGALGTGPTLGAGAAAAAALPPLPLAE